MNLEFLRELGIGDTNPGAYDGSWITTKGETVTSASPATGKAIGAVTMSGTAEYERVMNAAREAQLRWRELPAPIR
ncbi:MAG: aldehyde dehydrogenase family protein, partial [Planctomycetes bacterium]|nr:aldehyde dehydrogenase family protein [Planctomycetota bacterium]